MMKSNKTFEMYIHVPFCEKKCDYCDFLSFSGKESLWEDYFRALRRDIQDFGDYWYPKRLNSVFIGGGTPSLMPKRYIQSLLASIKLHVPKTSDCEITVECNPGTLTREKLKEYFRAGVNRLSIGLQSANDAELSAIGRIHDYKTFEDNFLLAREMGFSNINVDLMMGLPGQTLESYRETLYKVIKLNPEHISAYGLMLEEGTPMHRRFQEMPTEFSDEEFQCQLYEETVDILKKAGYLQYEVSNFCKPGKECRHNLGYWNRTEYIGIGLGAASMYENTRRTVTSDLETYIAGGGFKEIIPLTEADVRNETVMLSLRTKEGLHIDSFAKEFGQEYADQLMKKCEPYVKQGLLQYSEHCYSFSTKGYLVSNSVLADLMEE